MAISTDQPLPTNPIAAAQLLDSLKDKDPTLCIYPNCTEPRRPPEGTTGAAPGFCTNPKHNAGTKYTAITQLRKNAGRLPEYSIPQTQVSEDILSLKAFLEKSLLQEQYVLEQRGYHVAGFFDAIAQIGDTDITLAKIAEVRAECAIKVTAAEGKFQTEHSLRLSAEGVRDTARKEALLSQRAAEEAIRIKEDAEKQIQAKEDETIQRINDIEAERDQAIAQIREETKNEIEAIQKQAREEIDTAQTLIREAQDQAREAQDQAREAEGRAHDAELQAQATVTAAEKQVNDSHRALAHEQETTTRLQHDVDHLRAELKTTIVDASTRAEEDRKSYRADLVYERSQVTHLQENLTAALAQANQATTRADQLALRVEELQKQLLLLQSETKKEQNRENE